MVHSLARKVAAGEAPGRGTGSPATDRTERDCLLVTRIAEGDAEALGDLYGAYAAALLRLVGRQTQRAEAEDIVQTTFLRLAERAAHFDASRGTPRAWLFGIALHVLSERRRSLRRFAAMLVSWSRGAATSTAPSTAGGFGDDALARALLELPQPQRDALLLVEIEGFTCVEVARMADVPVGTIWNRLHSARKRLRERLGDDR